MKAPPPRMVAALCDEPTSLLFPSKSFHRQPHCRASWLVVDDESSCRTNSGISACMVLKDSPDEPSVEQEEEFDDLIASWR